jgi:hypothetical protein
MAKLILLGVHSELQEGRINRTPEEIQADLARLQKCLDELLEIQKYTIRELDRRIEQH